ncbi:MAG: DMT family transporter [Burkholderiales bacterium]|nr:DMT family transporter [Burkholderiales bacterium]
MLIGILCALGAGLLWGLVFVVPQLLADYPAILLSFGRYAAFGLVALVPAWLYRHDMRRLSRSDWIAAGQLSVVGNLVYYAALATAIQLADVPLPAMLIGTLPVVISICANWQARHAPDQIAWLRLLPSLFILALGLLMVNASELRQLAPSRSLTEYGIGCALTLISLACWTWYPIRNAQYLRAHPEIPAMAWATAQGLAILPLAILGYAAYGWYAWVMQSYQPPFGDRPAWFLFLMLASGLGASWLGTVLWNQASRRLPTSLVGQLIVFETLAALAYAFIVRGTFPPVPIVAGAVLLCVGVVLGVRAFRSQTF